MGFPAILGGRFPFVTRRLMVPASEVVPPRVVFSSSSSELHDHVPTEVGRGSRRPSAGSWWRMSSSSSGAPDRDGRGWRWQSLDEMGEGGGRWRWTPWTVVGRQMS